MSSFRPSSGTCSCRGRRSRRFESVEASDQLKSSGNSSGGRCRACSSSRSPTCGPLLGRAATCCSASCCPASCCSASCRSASCRSVCCCSAPCRSAVRPFGSCRLATCRSAVGPATPRRSVASCSPFSECTVLRSPTSQVGLPGSRVGCNRRSAPCSLARSSTPGPGAGATSRFAGPPFCWPTLRVSGGESSVGGSAPTRRTAPRSRPCGVQADSQVDRRGSLVCSEAISRSAADSPADGCGS